MLNLAVWFSLHVVFGSVREQQGPFATRWLVPDLATLDGSALAIAVGALVAMLYFRVRLLTVLGVATALGIAWHMTLA